MLQSLKSTTGQLFSETFKTKYCSISETSNAIQKS